MDDDVTIGMTRAKMREFAQEILAATESAAPIVTVEFDAITNQGGAAITLSINNDDMEDRPEVANTIIVDAD